MSKHRQRKRVPDCPRCGWTDRHGHYCTRSWFIPKTHWGISRSGLRRGGKIDHLSVALHWRWRGDAHKFRVHLSLGEHINVSARARLERQYREDLERAEAA